jgi:hypothetical protein
MISFHLFLLPSFIDSFGHLYTFIYSIFRRCICTSEYVYLFIYPSIYSFIYFYTIGTLDSYS